MTDAQIYRYATELESKEKFLLAVGGIAEEYEKDWDAAGKHMEKLYEVCNMDIKEIRKEKGLTQAAFADYINASKRTIEDWEAGRRNPPGHVKFLILEYAGLFKRKHN